MVLLCIELVTARNGGDDSFNDFEGPGHTGCHGSTNPESSSGWIYISSSSGTTVSPSEIFNISVRVISFNEAQNEQVWVGFPYGTSFRGDNQQFSFNTTFYSPTLNSSGGTDSNLYFQITAPSIEGIYQLVADAIQDSNSQGGAQAIDWANSNITINVVVITPNPPQFENLTESVDPLELGQTETFNIDVYDLETSVSTVFIELDSQNYTMVPTGVGNTYEYYWTPSTTGLRIYKFYANDSEGNWNSSINYNINVIDTTGPNIWNITESDDPLELGQNETIQVDAFDLSGISEVFIEINSANNYSMTDLLNGSYQYDAWMPTTTGLKSYKIFANDTKGNWNSTISYDITVEDTTGPTIENVSESSDPLEIGLIETIQVDVFDLSNVNYVWIEINEANNYSMTDLFNGSYLFSTWMPSSTGLNNYTIYANDTIGNLNFLSSDITVQDTIGPNIWNITESNDPLELGQTETIQVDVSDLSGISNVLIEINNVNNYSMTDLLNGSYQYNAWTPITTGLKSYKIYANDTFGNWNSTISYTINVIDTSEPNIWNITESDDPLELGQTETIQVNVSDLSGISMVFIEINGANNYSMTDLLDGSYQYNAWTPTSVGVKSYKIYANDTNGNWNSTISYTINVVDTIPPTWDTFFESQDPLPLGSNETIKINVYDSPGSGVFEVLLEYESLNHTMINTIGDTWEWSNWKPSAENMYIYTIYMRDNQNNLNTTSGDITVIISSGPTIENITKSDQFLELGDTETIRADVNDTDGVSTVLIELESFNYTMMYISGNKYEFNYTPSTVSSKPFIIYANDTLNNWNQLNDNFNVIDTTPPIYDNLTESPPSIELGENVTISIDASDLGGINEVKLEFDSANRSMIFIGGNTWRYNLTPSFPGNNQLYTIYIKDNSNNWNSTSGSFDVIDTTIPSIENVTESSDPLEFGQIETIQVDVSDLSGIFDVWIEINNGNNYSMIDLLNGSYQYNWNPLATGINNYTIWANDTYGNLNFFSDNILVQDTTVPTIENVTESSDPLEFGQIETIQVDVSDLSGIFDVWIEINNANNYSMTNLLNGSYLYNWNPFVIGANNYTIWTNDTYGNLNFFSDYVTVQDTLGPIIENVTESSDPLEFGQIETVQVDAFDFSSVDYVWIEINNANNYSMSDLLNGSYLYNWNSLVIGVNNYTIWANDTIGNLNFFSDNITVQDTLGPIIENVTESSDPLEFGQIETIQVDAIDLSGVDYVWIEINNAINYSMTDLLNSSYQYHWNPFVTGINNYTVWANDTYGNLNFLSDIVLVQDTTVPTIGKVTESADPLELGQTETIQIDVSDLSGISVVIIEINGANNYTMADLLNGSYQYNVWIPTTTGVKNYKIYANDTEGNWNFTIIYDIIVEDTLAPIIKDLLESADPLELGQTESIQVNVTDLSGISKVLIEIASTNYTMVNNSGIYNYSWSPSTIGIVNYIIYANDTLGLLNSITDNITVQDTSALFFENLIESADPIELGDIVVISIDVIDFPYVNQVLIEFENVNHSMTNSIGNTWRYDAWKPINESIHLYTIHMQDSEYNWFSLIDSIHVRDTTPPIFKNLTESDDPLNLGGTLIITVEATDISGINQVLIEFEGSNHSMTKNSGNAWRHDSGQLGTIGNIFYTIYAKDNNNNWNSIEGSIKVIGNGIEQILSEQPELVIVFVLLGTLGITLIVFKIKKPKREWDFYWENH